MAATTFEEIDMYLITKNAFASEPTTAGGKTKRHPLLTLVLMVGLAVAGMTQAGTTGTEFEALHTLLTGWANGYLGKALAVAAFLFGAGYGVAKQTIVPAILGIVFALVFAVGPGVIDGMLTAVI